MSIKEAKVGDVVQLVSGGPLMTIVNVGYDRKGSYELKCIWFDDNDHLHDGTFRGESIKRMGED